jgi:hypothetical protein
MFFLLSAFCFNAHLGRVRLTFLAAPERLRGPFLRPVFADAERSEAVRFIAAECAWLERARRDARANCVVIQINDFL